MTMKLVQSKYWSQCKVCRQKVHPGSWIWLTPRGTVHSECLKPKALPSRSEPEREHHTMSIQRAYNNEGTMVDANGNPVKNAFQGEDGKWYHRVRADSLN